MLQRNSYLQPGCHHYCWQWLLLGAVLLLPSAALVAESGERLLQQAGSSDSQRAAVFVGICENCIGFSMVFTLLNHVVQH